MAHHIYHTKAFVLRKVNTGEWDCRYLLFTKEIGLVSVLAKSARKPTSKMRGHLNMFSLVGISLVRGKEVWRLIGVENLDLNTKTIKKSESRIALAQIFNLVKRLVKGEDPHPELFNELYNTCQTIKKYVKDDGLLEKIELVAVLRILNLLGYIPDVPELRSLTKDFDWSEFDKYEVNDRRLQIVKTINQSLQETHL